MSFAGDLPDSTFHLRIGASDEPNDVQDSATNVGTLYQRAEFQVYESPVQLDENGDPVYTPIRDNATAISRISVDDTFLVRDVEVEINMDHAWSPDLRVFLVGPDGDRVELIRDVGSDVLGGQIYGTKFNDLDGDGVQDEDEPGLPGWTIYIDDNRNSAGSGRAEHGYRLARRLLVCGLEWGRPIGWRRSLSRCGTDVAVAGGREELFRAGLQ